VEEVIKMGTGKKTHNLPAYETPFSAEDKKVPVRYKDFNSPAPIELRQHIHSIYNSNRLNKNVKVEYKNNANESSPNLR